jgi:hypothetical protein
MQWHSTDIPIMLVNDIMMRIDMTKIQYILVKALIFIHI